MTFFGEQWSSPPDKLLLPAGEVHIWRASLEQPVSLRTNLWQILSLDEQERARRFRFEWRQNAFIVGRGLLRAILGQYLDLAPQHLRFIYGENGKPSIEQSELARDIQFNVSHSHELALYAFVQHYAVGIDIEYISTLPELTAIVDSFFSVQEKKNFRALSQDEQTKAFFAAWTRKEAYLKACSNGLAMPLSQFEVSFALQDVPRIVAIAGNTDAANAWFLHDILLPDYKAALVINSKQQWRVRQWNWTENV